MYEWPLTIAGAGPGLYRCEGVGDRTEDCPGSPSGQKEIHTGFESGKLDEHVRNDIATKSGVDIRRREAS